MTDVRKSGRRRAGAPLFSAGLCFKL